MALRRSNARFPAPFTARAAGRGVDAGGVGGGGVASGLKPRDAAVIGRRGGATAKRAMFRSMVGKSCIFNDTSRSSKRSFHYRACNLTWRWYGPIRCVRAHQPSTHQHVFLPPRRTSEIGKYQLGTNLSCTGEGESPRSLWSLPPGEASQPQPLSHGM